MLQNIAKPGVAEITPEITENIRDIIEYLNDAYFEYYQDIISTKIEEAIHQVAQHETRLATITINSLERVKSAIETLQIS